MKIVCGNCGAKYSIADEKVQGKVFKIRCKKCSDVIVVKGTTDDDPDEVESGYSSAYGQSGSASEWYVVIDGEQQGPMAPDEVSAYCASGQLSADSFCWREGLEDWVMLAAVEEFAHFIHATAGPHEETMIASQHSSASDYSDPEPASGGYQDPEDSTAVMTIGQFQAASAQAEASAQADFGYDSPGYDSAGYDSAGYDSAGYDSAGYDSAGYNAPGYDAGGYDSAGYDPGEQGQAGYGQGGYEPSGYDAGGYDQGDYGGAAAANASPQGGANYGVGSHGEGSGYGDGGGYGAGYDDEGGGMFAAFDSSSAGDADLGGLYGGMGGSASSDHDSGPDWGGAEVANDLVGARNENSVLFSLSSLDQIQSVSKPAPFGGNFAGAAEGNDKSGLIDIQKLASAHTALKGGSFGDDEGAEAFAASSMAMPALMPMGSHRNNKPLIIGVIVGTVLLILILVTVVIVALRPQQPQIVGPAAVVASAEPAAPAAPSEAELALAAEAQKAAQAALEAAEKDEPEAGKAEEEEQAEQARTERKTAPKTAAVTAAPRESAPAPARTQRERAPAPARTGGGIDDIIGSLDKKASAPAKTGGSTGSSAAASNLPPSLSRAMVQSTIQRHNAAIAACSSSSNSGNLSGTATVRFTVEPNGSVSAANVQPGEFRGTDVGGCIERVVRGMNFPATSGDSRTINYPFILR